jgi:hypothetical protein
MSFPEPEPWPEAVDGAALLDELSENIRSHVVMATQSADVAALWVVHTYTCRYFAPAGNSFPRETVWQNNVE